MSELQSFCICKAETLGAYTAKSKWFLSLDKDDFVLNGYPVDIQKCPIKPAADGKKVSFDKDEDEDKGMDTGGEEKETEIQEGEADDEDNIFKYHTFKGNDPSCIPSK